MNKFAKVVTSHPKKIIFVFSLITLIFSTQIPLVKINTSTKSLVEEDVPCRLFYEDAKKTFGNEEIILLAIENTNIFLYETLVKIKELTESIEEMEHVSEVNSIINAKHIEGSDGMITVKPLFREIPKSGKEILKLKTKALSNEFFVNNIISKDGDVVALIIYLEDIPEEELYKKRIVETIVTKIKDMIEKLDIQAFFYLGGSPILRTAASQYMLNDLIRYVPFTALLIILVLFLSLKSPRGVVLPLIGILIGLIWTIGFMTFMGKEINIVTIIIPSLLLAIGCAYTMHLLNQYYEEAKKEKNKNSKEIVLQTLCHIGKPLIFIAGTTMAGFSSLGVSNVVPIKEFGLFFAFGIFCMLLVVLFFLPACLAILTPFKSERNPKQFSLILTKLLFKIGEMNIQKPKIIISVSILFFGISVLGITKLKVECDNMAIFKKNAKVRIDNQTISEKLSGVNVMSVILEGEEEDTFKDPIILKKMIELQKYMENFKEVDTTHSLANFIQQMNMAIYDNNPNFKTVPDNKDLVAQYLLLYSNAGDPDDFDRYVDYDYKKVSIVYQVNIYNMKFYLKLAEKIKEFVYKNFPKNIKVEVTGALIITAKAFDEIVNTQIKSLSLAFIIITFLLFLLFKSFKLGLIAMIPNILPIMMSFGIMGWLGIRLDLPTSVFACVALGIAVDDTIHFSTRYSEELKRTNNPKEAMINTLQITGFPIIITSIAITLGFLVFVLSNFVPIILFGLITAWVMVICLIGDLILLPVLLIWVSKKDGV